METIDLGRRISPLGVPEGTPVYDPGGRRIGVVDHVSQWQGIFDGLVVHTVPLPGQHVFAAHDQIEGAYERGVRLAVGRDELHAIEKPRRQRPLGDESRLEAALRRAWDWIHRPPG